MAALDPLKKAAIYAMSLADEGGDVARVADDWGWKGPKKGELSGNDVFRLLHEFRDPDGELQMYKYGEDKKFTSLIDRIRKQWGPTFGHHLTDYDIDNLAMQFETLESADIGRDFTGRLVKYGQRTGEYIDETADADWISKTIRSLSPDQREVYRSLLPEWEGSLDDLAEAARSL